MTRKMTFRKSWESSISAITTQYTSVLDLYSLLHSIKADTSIIQPKLGVVGNTANLEPIEEAVVIIDTTVLVYRTTTVSFSGATRCTLAFAVKPITPPEDDDGYIVSRQSVCTDIPCSPTWDIYWYVNGSYGRQMMLDDSVIYLPGNSIEMAISQNNTGEHRYFVINEINIYEAST